ncbi:outer membrane protein assembly factor BamB family protein [Tuwongella immobilis]|uniref:Pyrrolo-quinoline quinone repeat domain-containing protein n=1 Tax=Tuwongella immobilis TaxID=692036 RepID=A0A6C2YIK7_9BACT|nr:PQQ-binding-like beta-propeller repeat protein [Tuwongella immobilis]VIP00973.1 Uncharacterized protein OS=Planctomyces maris DSM 8797 GN=PM8797T_30936 PE=4 SV=1: PQQ_2: PQQ_2 [Tuwongella immobilis]VTR97364.1 Uncharacterized protein OS=Planctomyces maris DSM 8797 GN=PM8797T_30936 PE=4 SV=1: PQQ_2: PQQ_2 [Tuwongella immobilis]
MWMPVLLSLMLPAEAPATNWPGFRGDGSSTSRAQQLPLSWSPSENIAWRTPLPGYGQSSPIIWNDRVMITAVEGDEKEKIVVAAIELKSGKMAWWRSLPASQRGKNNPMMSRAAPTPVVDSEGIYAFFESGDLIAFSHQGDLKWKRSLATEYGAFKNNHGIGSSPTQTAECVIVLIDDMGGSYLLAIDKATGKNRWKTDRTNRVSWTSPVILQSGGRSIVIVSSGGSLTAYDAQTGKPIANRDGLVGNTIPSPTVLGNRIIIGAGENRMKPDPKASAQSNCCVELQWTNDSAEFVTRWNGKKAVSHHASPLVYQGHVYFVTKMGVITCLNAETGEECYVERLDNPCWATPVGADGHVFFFGKYGVSTVIRAGSSFEKIAINRLWSPDEFRKRQDDAKRQAAAKLPPAPSNPNRGPGGGPPVSKEELEAARYSAVGDVVYGAAAVDGTWIIRTGTELICVRTTKFAAAQGDGGAALSHALASRTASARRPLFSVQSSSDLWNVCDSFRQEK